ncbi:uncharacterized protein LOC117252540 isoform X2 [Epinephelus lanceolatus]
MKVKLNSQTKSQCDCKSSRMFHVMDRQFLNFQFGAFTVLLFHPVVFLALIHSCTGQSQLIGPSQPIVALVGDDIILPCHLDPAMNAFDMTVEWARPDLDPRFVVVWRDGVELESKKHPSYRGRTSVFTDELKHGNVSLKLSNVRRSDEATYRCFIPAIDRARTVQLVVGAVSSPVIHTTKTMSEVVLQCESAGWYPEPEVLWLDAEGNLLSAGPTETLRGPDDLYTVSSNVTVDKRHGNNFTCRVHQKNINQTRETHVLVPDHFFMVPSTTSSPSTPSTTSTTSTPVTPGSQQGIIGSVIGCAALVLIPAAVFVVWKWRHKKFKNKRRSHEDGPEQMEAEKMVTSRSDNTGFQVVVEGEGERVPLMAGSEGQNNVDNRGEEKIESHSEHEDPQVGAERETHQNQLVTKPDMDRTEGEREVKSIENENLPLIATEGQNHQEQDMTGRQVLRDRGEGGVEQKMKPVKEDSGLPVAEEAEGQKEQPQNVHTDQDVQDKEETQQEPMTDEDKKEKRNKTKKVKGKNEKQVNKGGSGSIGQKKNQRDPSQPEAERTTVEDETKLQSETQKRKETEKDDIELKPQQGNVSQRLLQDKKQEMREAEHEEKKDKDQEGNQSNIQRTTERKAEKQEEKLKEEKMENERKLQSERTELKTQEGGDNQQVLDANRPEQTAEHENKKDKDQRDVTTTTESKAEKQEEHINKKVEETEGKRDGREDKPPSVSGEITQTPDLKEHEDTAGGQNQEKELQAEKQQQETSLRKMDETKEQPKRSTNREWIPWKERRKQELGRKKGADITETPKEVNEVRQEGQQQAVQQQLDVKEDVTEQIQDFFKSLSERGAECQDTQPMETDVRPIKKAKRRGKHQHIQVKEFHVDHQQIGSKKRPREEDSDAQMESEEDGEPRQKTFKQVKERPDEQNDVQMKDEDDSEKEKEVTDEPEGMDLS